MYYCLDYELIDTLWNVNQDIVDFLSEIDAN